LCVLKTLETDSGAQQSDPTASRGEHSGTGELVRGACIARALAIRMCKARLTQNRKSVIRSFVQEKSVWKKVCTNW